MPIPGVNKKTIDDVSFTGKRVFVRVDYNVPLSKEDGHITDETRIIASMPTLKKLLAEKPRSIVLASHLGRPKGKADPKASLRPLVPAIEKHLGVSVTFVDDCIGEKVVQAAEALPEGGVLLLENIRFYPEEETKNTADRDRFSAEVAKIADVYVNDAFGTSHRAHASMYGVPAQLPVKVAGYLVAKEVGVLKTQLDNPQRPFVAIVGGAKVSDKIGVLENFLQVADEILIGGAMAYPFLKAQGNTIGTSMCSEEDVELATKILAHAGEKGFPIHLPTDHVIVEKFDPAAPTKTTEDANVPDGWMGVDIGPKSIAEYEASLQSAGSVCWNGPMGVFEWESACIGTKAVAQALAGISGMTIVGGGDSVAAVNMLGLDDKMGHISTGGGASLEFLEGKMLPGVEILDDAE